MEPVTTSIFTMKRVLIGIGALVALVGATYGIVRFFRKDEPAKKSKAA